MKTRRFLLLAARFSIFLWGDPAWSLVDLHAHLFMEEANLHFLYKGHFSGPLQSKGWNDHFGSRVNAETLDKSDLTIVVASLYALPLISGSVKGSIRNQIDMAKKFVAQHRGWQLVRSSSEARQALRNHQRVMILSLEGAAGILENKDDIEEFVDREGIRIVTLLHLLDDGFGGGAFMPGLLGLLNPISFAKSLWLPRYTGNVRVNPNGLTSKGKEILVELLKRGVWIDLSHASDSAYQDMKVVLKKAHQPFLYTHTVLRNYYKAERGISIEQLREVGASGGIIGLQPSRDLLRGTPPTVDGCSEGGVDALAKQFLEASAFVGRAVTLGTDSNAPILGLEPHCARSPTLSSEGYWNLGQIGELERSLRELGAPMSSSMDQEDLFLKIWERAESGGNLL